MKPSPLPLSQRFSKQPSSSRRWLRWMLLGGLLFCSLLGFALSWYSHPRELLAINSVQITGDYNHLDRANLQQLITPYADSNLLFVNAKELATLISQIPWVATVSVTRVWPNGLKIHIIEHTPVARWNNNQLLNESGIAFDPGPLAATQLPSNLPWLNGPDQQDNKVWQTYQQLLPLVTPIGLSITSLNVDARQSWQLVLNNGMKLILGQIDLTQRLQRLVNVYSQVFGSRGSEVEYVDLRYTNGMAVHWKSKLNATS